MDLELSKSYWRQLGRGGVFTDAPLAHKKIYHGFGKAKGRNDMLRAKGGDIVGHHSDKIKMVCIYRIKRCT